ncbi:unnamed protein product [Acanthosepion pharaonis]|uniref:Uncharacterized protein n=1 Tax=Acanthosepion pharaonis TaxID=158019 RepID=A0A812CVN8_ACAPH|nr:unnamed protein product [Sepia pharaonis]
MGEKANYARRTALAASILPTRSFLPGTSNIAHSGRRLVQDFTRNKCRQSKDQIPNTRKHRIHTQRFLLFFPVLLSSILLLFGPSLRCFSLRSFSLRFFSFLVLLIDPSLLGPSFIDPSFWSFSRSFSLRSFSLLVLLFDASLLGPSLFDPSLFDPLTKLCLVSGWLFFILLRKNQFHFFDPTFLGNVFIFHRFLYANAVSLHLKISQWTS